MRELSAQRFLEQLAQGKPVAGLVLLGGELYLRDLCRERLVAAYVPAESRSWGVSRFSAEDDTVERVLRQAQTLPLLCQRQVIFYADVEALERLEEKARDAAAAALAGYFKDPAPFTVLVLEAASLDKRLKLYKALAEHALLVEVELPGQPDQREATAALMAEEMARGMGVELCRDAAQELSECCNGELARMRTELEKLATFVAERRRITREDVERLVISAKKYSVWELADMLAGRDRSRALKFLDSLLREGEPAPALVGAMAWMFRKLLEAQELSGRVSGAQAARQLGMRGSTAEMALRQSRKFQRGQLLDGLAALSEADNRLKLGPASPRAVMEFLVSRLTGGAAAKSA